VLCYKDNKEQEGKMLIKSKKSLATLNNQRLFFVPPTMREIMENPEWKPITLPEEFTEQMDFSEIWQKKG
tara:strand:+ start:126 stop:335 length:210 start_codon:yes stop_codon:yes gene_type:complete